MTREEHVKFCKICKNRKLDRNKGIVCELTNEIADFVDECSNFEEDGKPELTWQKINKKQKETIQADLELTTHDLVQLMNTHIKFFIID